MDGDGDGEGVTETARANAERFLMIMVHYSWITVLIILLLGLCSWVSHRKVATSKRTSDFGRQQTMQHTPGLLAHGGYPFIVRGIIGTTFFMLAVLPLVLIICSTVLGLIVAAVEGWEAGIGVEYLLSNVLGMTAPLTSIVPEGAFGIHFAIIINMYAVIMVTTAMGLVANMSLMQAITEKVPQGTCGFLTFLFVVVPIVMFVMTGIIGCIMAGCEGWSVTDGYYFMAASMASLANPVTTLEPETAFGSFFECLCLSAELCLGGCILGLVASHPVTMRVCDWLEGTSRAAHSNSRQDLAGFTAEELTAKLDAMQKKGASLKQIAQLRDRLGEANATEHINQLTGEVFKLEERIQAEEGPKDPQKELEELKARVAQLEAQFKQPPQIIDIP